MNKIALSLLLLLSADALAADLNIADPKRDGYADPAGQRASQFFENETVNEARLYDFYQRQADAHLKQESRPTLLPAYPGLDAGIHGHWGKHNQNSHKEPRVNDMDFGTLHFQRTADAKLAQGSHVVFVSLGSNLHTVFDPKSLTFPCAWTGEFIYVEPFRWGASRGAKPAGTTRWSDAKNAGWISQDGKPITGSFTGWYRYGKQTVFSYEIDGCAVLDMAEAVDSVFIRTLHNQGPHSIHLRILSAPATAEFSAHTPLLKQSLFLRDREKRWWMGSPQKKVIDHQERTFTLTIPAGETASYALWVGETDLPKESIAKISLRNTPDLVARTTGGEANWPNTLSGKEKTAPSPSGPVAIDPLFLPIANPGNSMMLLTGIDFTSAGEAIVCTLHGEVWRVSGLADPASMVHWRKIAAGINQPFGLAVDGEKIYVMARTQIIALHDLNKNGEIDFHEVIAADFDQRSAGIAMHFGLELTPDGDLLFIANSDLCRWSPDTRKSEIITRGFRNGMGLATLPDGRALVAPQEGNWTPASMIVEALEGEHYGFGGFGAPKSAGGTRIDLPLCYVPRGIDNSTGGMLAIDRKSWGPLNGAIYCFSYGAGTHYYVLQDTSGTRPQGAVVPLDGAFSSGVVRAAFNPADDHIYVVGTDGWGNYAHADGSFNRVRYTGEPMNRPIGYQTYANGIRVEFEAVLDPFAAEKTSNYLAQQWNYEYAERYGSPEFSIEQPDQLGHDVLSIRSVSVLPDTRSIFVEIPELKPASQVYLRMHLRTVKGVAFKTDLFPTIKFLGQPYVMEHLAPPVTGKVEKLTPRVRKSVARKTTSKSKARKKSDRQITLKALAGLRYDQVEMHATSGEKLAISLKNEDVAMQHNWVLVQPGAHVEVGEASFKMLSDPAAAEKNYVPDLPSVIADIPLVAPGETETVVIKVPKKPGRYPFLCTFPGHWQAMKGVLIVSAK